MHDWWMIQNYTVGSNYPSWNSGNDEISWWTGLSDWVTRQSGFSLNLPRAISHLIIAWLSFINSWGDVRVLWMPSIGPWILGRLPNVWSMPICIPITILWDSLHLQSPFRRIWWLWSVFPKATTTYTMTSPFLCPLADHDQQGKMLNLSLCTSHSWLRSSTSSGRAATPPPNFCTTTFCLPFTHLQCLCLHSLPFPYRPRHGWPFHCPHPCQSQNHHLLQTTNVHAWPVTPKSPAQTNTHDWELDRKW